MNWLAPVAKHCHIYHKGNKVIPHRQWETLPNVEREGRTYLHHIINKYDYLDDITVFLQGSLDKEKQYGRAYINISDYITLAQKNQITCSDHRESYKLWGRTNGLQQKQSIANVTFGEFCQTVWISSSVKYKSMLWRLLFSNQNTYPTASDSILQEVDTICESQQRPSRRPLP